jgi:hypothetical protein
MAPRIFLSHAWMDDAPARVAADPRRGLVRRLRDEGLEVFYDADELRPVARTGSSVPPAG